MADDDIWPDNTEPEPAQDNLKELREAAKRGKQAQDEAASAKRELAFLKAGIDTDSKLGQLLMKGYDGDLSVDAIKSFHSEAVGQPAPADIEPDVSAEVQAQAARTAMATGGQVPSTEPQPDPYEEAAKAKAKAIGMGKGRDEALADGFRVLLSAASNNDPRVEVGHNRP